MTIWTPDLDRPGPRYRAIADALAEDVRSGALPPGTRLPTHRDLARRLKMTVGTVSRAYAEAERRGLVRGEVGRGTFVRSPEGRDRPPLEPREELRHLLDLSMNLPVEAAEGSPGTALAETLASLAARGDLGRLLTYTPHAGSLAHRRAGADWIRRTGLAAPAERVLVTHGAQHATAVSLATLTRPGDRVLTEALTYPGVKAVARLLHLELTGVALDEHGLSPDALDRACRETGARVLYCVPTIQNPTGSVMPAERRREIAEVARKHDVAIVEDDIHGLLPPEPPLPLAACAPERSYYLASLAKSVAPGLRIGYLLAPEGRVDRLAAGMWATTWMTAPLMAEIAATWIADGTADRLLAERRREAAQRQRLAAEILEGFEIDTHPTSYHLWLHVPEPWCADDFVALARQRGVAITPPSAFVVGRGAVPHAVRVCLGAVTDPRDLETALLTLREILYQPVAQVAGVV